MIDCCPPSQSLYFDDSGLPKALEFNTLSELALPIALLRAVAATRHSDGHSTLPGIGLLTRTLVHHDPSKVKGLPLDDSEFLGVLVEVGGVLASINGGRDASFQCLPFGLYCVLELTTSLPMLSRLPP